ncbi:MAG: ATP-NAD kinase [Halobacteriales archaeon]|nr:ATP-NAD kinase [Halobacteriales archaeon]
MVGTDERVDTPLASLADGAIDLQADTAATVLANDPDVVVAVGESAVIELVNRGVSVPVLPVDTGIGLPSVAPEAIVDAVRTLADGVDRTHTYPILEVRVDGERRACALYDAMLVTTEPARISEFRVTAGMSVERFRADGVVVASPVGSYGYARRAGGPTIAPDTTAVAVVPVSAFATHTDQWVIDPDPPIEITIERNEGDITLLADDRDVGVIPHYTPIEFTFATDAQFEVVILEETEQRLEKL